jgi:hypothetical protein
MAAGRKGTRQARALWLVLLAVAPAIFTDQAEGSRLSDRPPFNPPGNQPQKALKEPPQDASGDGGMLGIYTGRQGWGEEKVKLVNENGYYIPEGAKGWDRIRAMARSSFARAERLAKCPLSRPNLPPSLPPSLPPYLSLSLSLSLSAHGGRQVLAAWRQTLNPQTHFNRNDRNA